MPGGRRRRRTAFLGQARHVLGDRRGELFDRGSRAWLGAGISCPIAPDRTASGPCHRQGAVQSYSPRPHPPAAAAGAHHPLLPPSGRHLPLDVFHVFQPEDGFRLGQGRPRLCLPAICPADGPLARGAAARAFYRSRLRGSDRRPRGRHPASDRLQRSRLARCLCLSPERNKRTVRTASLWQARQPVYSTSVARWRRYEPWLGELRELLPPT